MITVSTKSWHYRLLKSFEKYPRSLCSYVRWVTICCFIVAVFATALLGMAAGLVYVPLLLLKVFDTPEKGTLLHFLMPLGVTAWFLVFIAGLGWICETAKQKYRRWKWNSTPVGPKEPSLLSSWLKAKKEKVCPMIEYKD